MEHRPTRFALTGVLACIMAGGVATAAFAVADVAVPQDSPAAAVRPSRAPAPTGTPVPAPASAPATAAPEALPKKAVPPGKVTPPGKAVPKKAAPKKAARRLPSGVTTATSFWDGQTASGRSMRFATLASPYWPLGTKVKIIYGKKSAVGVVDDFGPAEWAVAQHDPPALVDISELMMRQFTGVRSETITARFEVLSWGKGRSYRSGGTGYATAMGDYAEK